MANRPIDADAAADAWDINVRRYIRRKNESTLWSAWKRTEGIRFLERAGALIGFKEAVKVLEDGLPCRAFAEVRPYVFSSGALTERRVGADGALRATRDPGFRGTAGLDAKPAPTPTLSLDLTANADFAQDEVDRVAQADSISTSPSDLYLVWTSQWPTDLPNGLPWRTPARGTLVATYVKYFRV